MKTVTSLSLHLLLGLLIGPIVFGQGPDATNGNNSTVPPETDTKPVGIPTTIATTAAPAQRDEDKVALEDNAEGQSLLKSMSQILTDEFGQASIPGNVTNRGQVLQAAMPNVNVMRIVKRFIAQDDIRHTLPKPEVVSQRCYDDVVDFIDGMIGQRVDANSTDYVTTDWAFMMMDAFGKPASGYLPGTLHWVGNYDECYAGHATIPAGTYLGSRPTARENSSDFYSRYCRVRIEVPSLLKNANNSHVHGFWEENARMPSLLHWGMCLPESCHEHEVEALVTQVTKLLDMSMTVRHAVCFERDRDLGSDAGAVFAICFLSIIGAVVVVCTLMESAIFFDYLPWNPRKQYDVKSDDVPTFSGQVSTNPSQGTDGVGDKETQLAKDDHNDVEQDGSKARSANPRTPLSRDGRPKDLLGEETPTNLVAEQETNRKIRIPSTGLKFLQAFSLRYNGSKLLSTDSNPQMIESVYGLRVLSILWIILGNTYTLAAMIDIRFIMFNTVGRIRETADRLTFTFVAAADLGVDTFFVIGGLLVMTVTLREIRRVKKGTCWWILFGARRMKRLLPVYMMVLMTGTTLYDHIVDGPLKSEPYMMFEYCDSHWWTNLLFMNNIIKPLEQCMPWTWYLAVDFQLYTFVPMFIMLYNKKYKISIIIQLVIILLATIGTFISSIGDPGQLLTMFDEDDNFFKNVYMKPHTRMPSYFIGMLTAVVLEDFPDKFKLSKLKSFLIWITLSGFVLFIIMIPHNQWKDEGDLWPKGTQALYETFKRPLWGLFIAWIIFCCQTGRGGLLADFLKWRGFQRLSRLTYTVYLVHPMILTFFLYERNLPLDLEDGVMIYQFLGNVIMSYLFAILFTLLFELPPVGLERMCSRRRRDDSQRARQ